MKYGWDIVQKVPIGAFFTKLLYVTQLGPNLKNVTTCDPTPANEALCGKINFKLWAKMWSKAKFLKN